MKSPSFLVLFLALLLGAEDLIAHSTSVVIIGGGPAGLGAAIEAHEEGAEVILVEKRSAYTRQNTLFLYAATLELFERWQVTIPFMEELTFMGQRRGFVLLKDLEEGLAHRVNALGIERIVGEFIDFDQDSHAAVIQTEEGKRFLPYDILVGADGAHSRVREKLKITSLTFGKAIGIIARIPTNNPENEISAEVKPHNEVFAKKVHVPSATVIFMQNRPGTYFKNLNLMEMSRLISELGWENEAIHMMENTPIVEENIPIYLQRASTFSDREKGVILLGDAAGVGSFYQGMGANFSFKSTQLAKAFFRNWPQEEAYTPFNEAMEIEVDALIKNNLPIFE